MLCAFIVTLSLIVLFLGFLFLRKLEQKQDMEIQKKMEQQYIDKRNDLDKEISDWLRLLELPSLQEENRRLEVARQLGIVLIEKVMRGPSVD